MTRTSFNIVRPLNAILRHVVTNTLFTGTLMFSILLHGVQAADHKAIDNAAANKGYAELVKLFHDWRAFEHPPMKDGAPDYTAVIADMRREIAKASSWQA